MNGRDGVNDASAAVAQPGALRKWLDPRRLRFWAVVLIVLYTLAGFFLVPALVRSQIVSGVHESLGRDASIERIRFNPYTLKLEIDGFQLQDSDGEQLATFDHFVVNFQASSLFRWSWTFRELRLEGLFVLFERFAPGDSRLTRLQADVAERAAPEPEAADESGGLPRLLIQELALADGRMHFRDHVPEDPVDLEFGPASITVTDLNTLPERDGHHSASVRLPDGAQITWEGTIDLKPFVSEGTVSVEDSRLDQSIAYLKAILPLQSIQASLSIETGYRINERADGSFAAELDNLTAELSDLALTGLQPASEFLAFSSLEVWGGTLRIPENSLAFEAIRLNGPSVKTWLDESGTFSLQQLAPTSAEGTPEPEEPSNAEAPWRLSVGEFSIADGRIGFTDRSIDPQAELDAGDVSLIVRDISNEDGAQFPLNLSGTLAEKGTFGFEGRVTVLPQVTLSGTASANALPVSLAQPYIQQQVNVVLNDGLLDTAVDVTLRPDGNLAATGKLTVSGLLVDDTLEDQPLVGWERLELDRFELDTGERALSLSLVTFDKPYGRLVIREDLTTNVAGLLVTTEAAPAAEEPADAQQPPYGFVLGRTVVRNGSMDFADFSLPLTFATHIDKLEGTVSTVDTSSVAPSNISMEGQVDEFGLARIEGAMDLVDPVRSTDVTMEFRNLLMSSLSPYSVQFAGRKIDEGKLNLDLRYRIVEGKLQGQNDIVMSDLVLGEAVEHPDAANLPLDLAIALLTDANGVIDIDLPVEGDINDPEFQIGGVIWQAVTTLITKVVTAPFRLLGRLIGIESEDLGQFQFLAGRADLTPPELEQVAQLQQALQQRPELAIEIGGAYDPEIDTAALKAQKLKAEGLERLGRDYADPDGEFRMLDAEIRTVVEALFVERIPDTTLQTVQAEHFAPPADDPEGKPVLDELAYVKDLYERLLAAEPVSEQELLDLARARAEAVRNAFLAGGEIDEARIVMTEPAATESQDGEWVVLELGVAVE